MPDNCAILHVDDDADIRLIVAMSLRLDSEIHLRTVATVGEALDALQGRDPFHPDAIIIDYMIGKSSGIDLLRRIREVPTVAAIPILFLTARMLRDEVAAMIAAGADGILAKPVQPDDAGAGGARTDRWRARRAR